MKLRLRRQENDRGEWSVLDRVRGYRICRYNHRHHDGTHVHFPETSEPLAPVDVASADEAVAVMTAYHGEHDSFALDRLQEVITTWKSASDAE